MNQTNTRHKCSYINCFSPQTQGYDAVKKKKKETAFGKEMIKKKKKKESYQLFLTEKKALNEGAAEAKGSAYSTNSCHLHNEPC